jgi:CRISPR-associated protein Cmr5
MTSVRQTLEQRRAAHSWKVVNAFRTPARKKDELKDFGREAKRLPMRIHTAGLGHALLFLNAKQKGKPGLDVLNAVCEWLTEKSGPLPSTDRTFAGVRRAITEGPSVAVRRATDEALAYLQWLSRFAEAEFGADEKV